MLKYCAILLLVIIFRPSIVRSQVIHKPIGCYVGTNGTNPDALAHEASRGVLLIEKWSDIEVTAGNYDFSKLNDKINTVKEAGLPYALAIAGGAFGSPDWLIDSLGVGYHDFSYQNQEWELPHWWDMKCRQKLDELIIELGNQYASDSSLSHVYVTQMTVNGVEGHLNAVDMTTFKNEGFSSEIWIELAKTTTMAFAAAFPEIPIVFEIHEIDHDTIVPAAIIKELSADESLCDRVGLGMWWISGKTSYQPDLIDFIYKYEGDKYAQIIGRSDQLHRFQDSLYSSVFAQAKYLNIRYLEPWPYEFQHHTHDTLLQDFNIWADLHFSPSEACATATYNQQISPTPSDIRIFPNPSSGLIQIIPAFAYGNGRVDLFNLHGERVLETTQIAELDISQLSGGTYFARITLDEICYFKKIVKTSQGRY